MYESTLFRLCAPNVPDYLLILEIFFECVLIMVLLSDGWDGWLAFCMSASPASYAVSCCLKLSWWSSVGFYYNWETMFSYFLLIELLCYDPASNSLFPPIDWTRLGYRTYLKLLSGSCGSVCRFSLWYKSCWPSVCSWHISVCNRSVSLNVTCNCGCKGGCYSSYE